MSDARTIGGAPPKAWIALAVEIAIFVVVLFGTAGTFRWPAAWALIALFTLAAIPLTSGLGKADPALLEERMKLSGQPGQPLWDRLLMAALLFLMAVWIIVPGFDAVRFSWSHVPLALQVLGAIAILASLWGSYRVMLQNSYLAPTVRIQQERGHKVISTGAYALVRHPFYAVLIPFFPAVGLLLGSWWCVVASAPIILLLAYRATREERHLAETLDGYADYMALVRYRLIPGVW